MEPIYRTSTRDYAKCSLRRASTRVRVMRMQSSSMDQPLGKAKGPVGNDSSRAGGGAGAAHETAEEAGDK